MMETGDELLARIAEALERIAPPPAPPADLSEALAWRWDGAETHPVRHFAPLPLDLIIGVDRQKADVLENSRRLAVGAAAHDVLLWGARGMGKSALVKSVVSTLADEGLPIALVEAGADRIATLPRLFALLGDSGRPFILFVDDIAFAGDDETPRLVRSMLEGGSEARPANVRIYVTSNRRNIVERRMDEQDDPVNPRDAQDDKLALADRFGLKLGFQYPDQPAFLAMVRHYTAHFALPYDENDALSFAQSRGGRSGRIAWHYAVELAGREGRSLS